MSDQVQSVSAYIFPRSASIPKVSTLKLRHSNQWLQSNMHYSHPIGRASEVVTPVFKL